MKLPNHEQAVVLREKMVDCLPSLFASQGAFK
jgi:hypothetical protein